MKSNRTDNITETSSQDDLPSPRDNSSLAFVRLIAATTFRRMGQIDAALKPFIRQRPTKLVYAALQTATAQLLYLGTPAHAAVGETVSMLKSRGSSKGFANNAVSGSVPMVAKRGAKCLRS